MAEEVVSEPALFKWAPGEAQRVSLFPIRHEDLWGFYKQIEASHWVAGEVSLEHDRADWNTKLTPDDREFVSKLLAFFANADNLVFANIQDNFTQEVDCMEAEFTYAAIALQECVHAEAYALQIEAVMDGEERERHFNACVTMPVVAAITDWVRTWFDRALPLGERLVALAMVEGVFFSGPFAGLQWMRERNLLQGITEYNEWISRDEGIHTRWACHLVRRRLLAPPAAARCHEIARGAADICIEFMRGALPAGVSLFDGMCAERMAEYVRFQADFVLALLGHPPLFGDGNPFPFMDKLAMKGRASKKNFFEVQATEYQKPGEGAYTFSATHIDLGL